MGPYSKMAGGETLEARYIFFPCLAESVVVRKIRYRRRPDGEEEMARKGKNAGKGGR